MVGWNLPTSFEVLDWRRLGDEFANILHEDNSQKVYTGRNLYRWLARSGLLFLFLLGWGPFNPC